MSRIAGVVASGLPDHVTQGGNRRHRTFFGDDEKKRGTPVIFFLSRQAGAASLGEQQPETPDHPLHPSEGSEIEVLMKQASTPIALLRSRSVYASHECRLPRHGCVVNNQ